MSFDCAQDDIFLLNTFALFAARFSPYAMT